MTEPTPPNPADLLLNLIVIFLTPMFLTSSNGDVTLARLAATQTINAYRAQTQADLLTVAQIVAFGLAALGSLSLSMTDNLSLSMTLRLRTNANACNRSAEQNRRALKINPGHDEPAYPIESPITPDEATIIAAVEAAKAETAARAVPYEDLNDKSITDKQRQAIWAAAAAEVAAEYTVNLASMPPEERKAATLRAEMLSSTAIQLLHSPPAPRPQRGALRALMQASAASTPQRRKQQ